MRERKVNRAPLQAAGGLILLAAGLALAVRDRGVPVKQLIQPAAGTILPLAVLAGLYRIKGFVMVIPMQALYLAGGALTGSLTAAAAVNALGTALCLSSGFFAGSRIKHIKSKKNVQKYHILKDLENMRTDSPMFFCFLIRMIGFLPCDAVSMYCGAKKVPYRRYLAGSLAGMLPGIILTGAMGANIHNPRSPRFIAATLFQLASSAVSVILYKKIKK